MLRIQYYMIQEYRVSLQCKPSPCLHRACRPMAKHGQLHQPQPFNLWCPDRIKSQPGDCVAAVPNSIGHSVQNILVREDVIEQVAILRHKSMFPWCSKSVLKDLYSVVWEGSILNIQKENISTKQYHLLFQVCIRVSSLERSGMYWMCLSS